MQHFRRGLAMTVGLLGCSLAGPALAQSGVNGSAQQSTYRSCAELAASEACNGPANDPRQAILEQVYTGGIGVFGAANLEIDRPGTDNDAYSRSIVSLGDFTLPEIRGETRAGAQDRMNINAFGFQTFTYTGTEAIAFSLTASLHIVDSSQSPADVETTVGAFLPGGGLYQGYVAIWDLNIIAGLTTARELIDNLLLAPCTTAGVLGRGFIQGALRGSEFSRSVTTTACSPGSLTLQPNQQVLTVAALRLPVNRGGFADATHSFVTTLDPTLGEDVLANLRRDLVPSAVGSVPEPTAWAMMIGGFGIVAAALRRRPRAARPCG